MKKVLIIGELNLLLGSLNQHLSSRFKTQMCVDNIDMVKGMVKIFRPDMAVICLNSTQEPDYRIPDTFLNSNIVIPVLFVGTPEECNCYAAYRDKGQFDYVTRPTTLGLLQQKCIEMLKQAVLDKDEEEVVVKEPESEKKCVLAVDDSGILLRSVKTMLERKYDVVVANSGMLAIKQAKKRIPDLILLDYEMPEWDGKRTLEEIRADEQLKDVPVVFLTAVADKAHIAAVLEMRPSGYLLKPIEQQVLIDTIEKSLIKI